MIEFQLVSDNDGHDYVIPYSERNEWPRWLDQVACCGDCDGTGRCQDCEDYEDECPACDGTGEGDWEPPDFAVRVNGPHTVVFTGWREL